MVFWPNRPCSMFESWSAIDVFYGIIMEDDKAIFKEIPMIYVLAIPHPVFGWICNARYFDTWEDANARLEKMKKDGNDTGALQVVAFDKARN